MLQPRSLTSPGEQPFSTPISRRSFITQSSAGVGALVAGLFGAEHELTREAEIPEEYPLRTAQDVLDFLEREYENIAFYSKQEPEDTNHEELEERLQLDSGAEIATRIYKQFNPNLKTDPKTFLDQEEFSIVSYVENFSMSTEEFDKAPPELRDCNDYTANACEKLAARGVPMYTLTMWPQKPQDRFASFHILSVCKIQDDEYIFIDNTEQVTHWKGSILSFIDQYGKNDSTIPPMKMAWWGLSRFVKPQYQNIPKAILFAVKLRLHIRHTIDSEDEMEPLLRQPDLIRIAFRKD